jgi:hypothetical protein
VAGIIVSIAQQRSKLTYGRNSPAAAQSGTITFAVVPSHPVWARRILPAYTTRGIVFASCAVCDWWITLAYSIIAGLGATGATSAFHLTNVFHRAAHRSVAHLPVGARIFANLADISHAGIRAGADAAVYGFQTAATVPNIDGAAVGAGHGTLGRGILNPTTGADSSRFTWSHIAPATGVSANVEAVAAVPRRATIVVLIAAFIIATNLQIGAQVLAIFATVCQTGIWRGAAAAVPRHTTVIIYNAAFCTAANQIIGAEIEATHIVNALLRASAAATINRIISTVGVIGDSTLEAVIYADV